jgi:excinuclease UvrABC nuclease subunit
MSNDYYVYAHYNQDIELVYIGKGKHSRAWQCERRNKDHYQFMVSNLPFLMVEILHHSLDENDALIKEKELIQKHKPVFNIAHTDKWGETTKNTWAKRTKEERRMICKNGNIKQEKQVKTPEGVFESVSKAAEVLGVNYHTAKSRAQRKTLGWEYTND